MSRKHCTAVLLSAGRGSRMKSDVAKQYMELSGKPVIYYSLKTLEESEVINDVVVVTGESDIDYFKTQIVERFGFKKVSAIIPGGKERYNSVANGVSYIGKNIMGADEMIFIHDGARPFLTEKMLKDLYAACDEYGAVVAAVKSKDTVKISDEDGFVVSTPNRSNVWNIQTPQVFDGKLLKESFEKLISEEESGVKLDMITDDACVVERYFPDVRVKLVEADYTNIKVTTPEDMAIAEKILLG